MRRVIVAEEGMMDSATLKVRGVERRVRNLATSLCREGATLGPVKEREVYTAAINCKSFEKSIGVGGGAVRSTP